MTLTFQVSLLLISAEKTKDLGLAYDDSPFLDKDFAVRLFVKSQKILLKQPGGMRDDRVL
jgi:hypothetical protein